MLANSGLMTPPCGVPSLLDSLLDLPARFVLPSRLALRNPSTSPSTRPSAMCSRTRSMSRSWGIAVEVALDVHVHDMHVPCFSTVPPRAAVRLYNRVRAGTHSCADGKAVFKDWLDDHSQRCLHHAVGDRGYPQRSLFRAAGFRDPDPFDRLGLIGAFLEMLSSRRAADFGCLSRSALS